MVLLKNDRELLPLTSEVKRIILIGGHADKGVATGGGSAQVIPHGGVAYRDLRGSDAVSKAIELLYAPSVPLAQLRAEFPAADVRFNDGSDPRQAAAAAKAADIAIVFVTKPSAESLDSPELSLPDEQDALIDEVGATNASTVVVLETGGVVVMPWVDRVAAVIEAWYPGQRGAEALAAILSGRVAPSGHLSVSFPCSVDQLPRPKLPGWYPGVGVDLAFGDRPAPFDIDYFEGSDVGYRWYERQNLSPLFAFGHGLTYTRFSYDGLTLRAGTKGRLLVRFTVTNTGQRSGNAVPQIYVAPPGRTHRLVGWSRIALRPGERRAVEILADRRLLASFIDAKWRISAGEYDVEVGAEAGAADLKGTVSLSGFELPE